MLDGSDLNCVGVVSQLSVPIILNISAGLVLVNVHLGVPSSGLGDCDIESIRLWYEE